MERSLSLNRLSFNRGIISAPVVDKAAFRVLLEGFSRSSKRSQYMLRKVRKLMRGCYDSGHCSTISAQEEERPFHSGSSFETEAKIVNTHPPKILRLFPSV